MAVGGSVVSPACGPERHVVRCGAVVFGIIIDTFGDLRGQTKDKQDDMNGVCFICGIARDEFDRNANGFEDHTEHDHNVRNPSCSLSAWLSFTTLFLRVHAGRCGITCI
jgi:hypothetical protein